MENVYVITGLLCFIDMCALLWVSDKDEYSEGLACAVLLCSFMLAMSWPIAVPCIAYSFFKDHYTGEHLDYD